MNMMMYVMLTIFIACLMIGRTPQFLGKKIEEKEMKLIALCILIHPAIILLFSALAVATTAGVAGITNPGLMGYLRFYMNSLRLRRIMALVLKDYLIIRHFGMSRQV